MPLVPAVPDGDIFPGMWPIHVESAEAALLEYLHAIAFYGDLSAGCFGPGFEHVFGVSVAHYHYVQSLCGPEIAYGHLMQGHIFGH